jgi:DNA-binding response OmpR family regulator
MLAELGFSPRRVKAGDGLRPASNGSRSAGGCSSAYPTLILMLCGDGAGGIPADEFLRRMRADLDLRDVPLIVVVHSARAATSVTCDEIIVHPLRIEELGVRIARARSRHGIVTQDIIRLGSLDIDLAAYEVRLHGEPLELTHMEYRLLELLVTHPRRVHTRERLLSRMWGDDHVASTRTVDGHVGRLRAKLGPEHGHRICTVRNVGYRFEP